MNYFNMQLKVNDIITKDGYTRKVLEVLTNTILTSVSDNFNVAEGSWCTEQELINTGWIFPKVEWKPEIYKQYCYIDEIATVVGTIYTNEYDEARIKVGNCYQTEAEAQEALKRVLQAYKG